MNKKHKFPIFFEEEGDNGSGGGSRLAGILPPVGGAEPHEPNNEPGGDEPEPEPEPVSPQQVTLDPAAFAEAIKAAGLGSQQRQQQQDTPLTPEQIKEYQKKLNFWEPTPEWLAKYDNLETRAQAILEQRDGMTQQFATMMQAYFGQQLPQLEQRFAPALDFVKQHESQAIQSRFDGTYPELAKPELRPLFEAVVSDLKKQGKTFPDEKALFAAVGAGMAQTIRGFNPDFKLTAGSSPAKPTSPNAIRPTPRGGAGGGGNNGSDPQAGVPTAVRFLPKVKA